MLGGIISYDHRVPLGSHVGLADRCDRCAAATGHRPYIDEEHLVFAVVDDLPELGPELDELAMVELAAENRVL